METRRRDASPMFSRSRHRGMVIDAGLNARRPSEDHGLSASHASGSYDSYVGGGLLRPGTRSAPPTSTMSAGIDDSVAVRQSQGRLSVDTADGRLYVFSYKTRHVSGCKTTNFSVKTAVTVAPTRT